MPLAGERRRTLRIPSEKTTSAEIGRSQITSSFDSGVMANGHTPFVPDGGCMLNSAVSGATSDGDFAIRITSADCRKYVSERKTVVDARAEPAVNICTSASAAKAKMPATNTAMSFAEPQLAESASGTQLSKTRSVLERTNAVVRAKHR